MPELAEVEYYRKRWNCGFGETISEVTLHPEKRVFRGIPASQLGAVLRGAVLAHSEANGKQLLFRFSKGLWLGLHLGMTGELRVEPPSFHPGKHDHLVLFQRKRALVFSDPRLFGRVQFHSGTDEPNWWQKLPPPINSTGFTQKRMEGFLARHPKLPMKAVLLLQPGFPGVGNWMADEILWRAKINPTVRVESLSLAQVESLWRSLRFVCQGALKHVARDVASGYSDPPRGWLFHERWEEGGRCPIHAVPLERQKIAGRTSAWCRECQV